MLRAIAIGTVVAALSLVPLMVAAESPIVVAIQIHPKLSGERCGRLPDASEIPEEEDFPKLLTRGWVSLKSHTFDAARKFWPCMQEIRVAFPDAKLYREFAGAMSACPQYPFYGGADYALQKRIFERTAELPDTEVLKILLSKDGRCVSEMNPPLYAILRKNPRAFVASFAKLSAAQQEVAASSQYDFNLEVGQQQFSPEAISSLPKELRPQAIKFNELLAAAAR